MESIDNMQKHEIYKDLKVNLKKAMNAEFYYQAIFIEYAIIEDRCASLLDHAGINYHKKNGYEIDLHEKIDKIKGNPLFSEKFIRKHLPPSLMSDIDGWRNQRNVLIHQLANTPYNFDSIKKTAEDGMELQRILDNSVKSINKYLENKAKK